MTVRHLAICQIAIIGLFFFAAVNMLCPLDFSALEYKSKPKMASFQYSSFPSQTNGKWVGYQTIQLESRLLVANLVMFLTFGH